MTRSTFLWIGLVAVAFAAVWLAFLILPTPSDGPSGDALDVRFEAQDPWTIGNAEDAFAYAGKIVRIIQGTANLQINPSTNVGMIEFVLQPDEALAALLGDKTPESSVVLRMQLAGDEAVWTDLAVHRGSEVGDSRLPKTHALYASSGSFELLIDGVKQSTQWHGFWSIGDALRQPDGSIRNQGLVFSPLLRDQSGFSDPNRVEFTLLILGSPESNVVIFHLVFPDVRAIER